jgi:CDP-diacylglycerol--serine O-phosphatidyltransferase
MNGHEPPQDGTNLPDSQAARIYFLPNLMTAGNLFCGFVAVIRCIQARQYELRAEILGAAHTIVEQIPAHIQLQISSLQAQVTNYYKQAVWLLLAAVIFDSLDGRLARLGGKESLFGKEFDSLADIVSFGMAPALMVFFLILSPQTGPEYFVKVGWLVGFLYLLCGAIRLARFNVLTRPVQRPFPVKDRLANDFIGLPIPAAAGTVASIVLVVVEHQLPKPMGIVILGFLLLIAVLMVSTVRYPSFKQVDWNMKTRLSTFVGVILAVIAIIQLKEIALALIFLAYVSFGVARHIRISLRKAT